MSERIHTSPACPDGCITRRRPDRHYPNVGASGNGQIGHLIDETGARGIFDDDTLS
ncbi:hypothetical protein [Nitrogeniibacter aestuarii]|uniref:hypothetical protein n=1 Tax=Nitrogeniibacter aestuarii TaxID=2815343 RepID=UPI001E58E112|nr:hypothetical protein [Nitrogeniibacter aestuarii]